MEFLVLLFGLAEFFLFGLEQGVLSVQFLLRLVEVSFELVVLLLGRLAFEGELLDEVRLLLRLLGDQCLDLRFELLVLRLQLFELDLEDLVLAGELDAFVLRLLPLRFNGADLVLRLLLLLRVLFQLILQLRDLQVLLVPLDHQQRVLLLHLSLLLPCLSQLLLQLLTLLLQALFLHLQQAVLLLQLVHLLVHRPYRLAALDLLLSLYLLCPPQLFSQALHFLLQLLHLLPLTLPPRFSSFDLPLQLLLLLHLLLQSNLRLLQLLLQLAVLPSLHTQLIVPILDWLNVVSLGSLSLSNGSSASIGVILLSFLLDEVESGLEFLVVLFKLVTLLGEMRVLMVELCVVGVECLLV